MAEIRNRLLVNVMRELVAQISAAEEPEPLWAELEAALGEAEVSEIEEIALPVLDRSLDDVTALLDAWDAGKVPLAPRDRGILKRALKAYRKRLKIFRLDDEVSGSRGPFSKGAVSAIQGITPPEQYAQEIWDRLVMQGRLRDAGDGLLELVE